MEKLLIDVPQGFSDFKEMEHMKNCLNYVAANFYDVEPIIREYYLKKEMKKLKEEHER